MRNKAVGFLRILSIAAVFQFSAAGVWAASGYPAPATPPTGAPNVLLVMTDDVGFAASSTFGGAIPTPSLDRLAAHGLTYNNFYTTALCSPTRAALLTGRNHHAVNFGSVPELATGEVGYTSLIPKSAGTIAQVLGRAGYDTAMLGKNHNVPTWQSGSLGPFDQWASGLGFRYFYGFNGGFTDQFRPSLIENTRMIEPPNQPGYILDRDLADHAISWLQTQRTQHPGTPFFLYYAPGTAHAPVQAPADWIAKFKGKFDSGWDAYRAESLARQKHMGIVPKDTKLAPLPDGVRPWSQLSPDERKVAARFMEAYAGALAFFDDQFGRVMAELKRSGQLDNTLVIFIEGDNGASGEGGEMGAFNYLTRMLGGVSKDQEVAYSLRHLDAIGGPDSYEVGPAGWAAAMNTPFPYYKVVASRLGGVRNGMVISWPARLKGRALRTQFAHVTDIMPTILEATGIKAPAAIDGVAQQPFDGASFASSFFQPHVPSQHHTQYFEVFGHAAIYQDGWFLAEPVKYDPRFGAVMPAAAAPWQLYDLNKDFSQTRDVAGANPTKVAEMKALWKAEATRNHVLPQIFNNLFAMLPGARPELLSGPGRYTFYPSTNRYPEGVFPPIINRSWSIQADLDIPAHGANGVLVTQGGRAGGWALTVINNVPTFFYRRNDRDESLFRLASEQSLSMGKHRVILTFTNDGPGFGRGGNFTMELDGKAVARGNIERTAPFKFAAEDATIGYDTGTAISADYVVPFAYTDTLDDVVIELGPVQSLQLLPQSKATDKKSVSH